MKKLKLLSTILALNISLFSGFALADYQNVSTSNVGQITSINMIPTQAQYLVLNIENVKRENINSLTQDVEKFQNYNGNISQFISSGILKKYDLSSTERGQTKMSISELKSYQDKGKNIEATFIKKSNSVSYNLKIIVNGEQHMDSGDLNVGQNDIKIGENYIVLISYNKF